MTRVVVLGGGSAGEAFVGALSRLEGEFELTLVEISQVWTTGRVGRLAD